MMISCLCLFQDIRAPAGGLAALLEHFASLGVPPAQLHLAMGAVLHASAGGRAPPSAAWAQPSVQRIVDLFKDADVDALRVHVLGEVGGGADVQGPAAHAMRAVRGDGRAALAALRRCVVDMVYSRSSLRRHAADASTLPAAFQATRDLLVAQGVSDEEVWLVALMVAFASPRHTGACACGWGACDPGAACVSLRLRGSAAARAACTAHGAGRRCAR